MNMRDSMPHKKVNAIIAALVFVVTLTVYLVTLAPTVVFWDVGEFIAAAKLMQVPHPPGSPLFLLITRLSMIIPFAADQAVRAHALSALLSSLAIMFFYLVIVRVIRDIRGTPGTFADRIAVFGSALIGAFSLAFTMTYWDNSIEAEVYGASMFFLTIVLWLAMKWRDHDGAPGNEKYILLIAYLIGLSLGVHLLALLAIFPVMMFLYFKRYDFTVKSFIQMALVTVAVFFVVYPGIVKYVPGMMDGEFGGKKSQIIAIIPWVIIAGVFYGVYRTYRSKTKMMHIGLLAIALVFLGYTTYVSVLIRSNAHPPMNENDPSNLARLTSYLNREQYGEAPIWPRRTSTEPHQQGIYTNYTSEWDFLFRYQLNHMFFRYVGWNYIGQESDVQDSPVSLKDTYGIPLWVGLFGFYYLFKKNWKLGLVFLAMFVIFGPILALYQNQQEPQPRERDYFYVGAYYVFSLWIAIGVIGIIDLIIRGLKQPRMALAVTALVVVAAGIAVPANMVRVNWANVDRRGNYVAWDYSYNILQTCEKDAILFTNGDNDTFPLWYLQDVEGIRRDVRIVNLSLVNTPWYIKQMKEKPYYQEAQAVPISISDARIAAIQPVQWEPRRMEVAVPPDVIARFGVRDTAVINQGKMAWTMPNTLQFRDVKAIRVQDMMVLDILRTNQWKRPIYFAVTCAPDSRIGLDEYLWFHGLAWRLEPRRVERDEMGLDPVILRKNLFDTPEGFSTGPQFGYKFRRINDPSVLYDENTTRLMVNYRTAFVRLAMYYTNFEANPAKAAEALERMEQLIPATKIPYGWELGADLAGFFYRLGKQERFEELASYVEGECRAAIAAGQVNMQSYYNPYRVLLEIYDLKRDYVKSLDLLKDLAAMYPNDPVLKQRIEATEQMIRQAKPADSLRPAAPQPEAR
jgi:hypothetical protein